jgi:hypothetical protein
MSRTRFQGLNFEQEIVIQYLCFIATTLGLTVRCRKTAINSFQRTFLIDFAAFHLRTKTDQFPKRVLFAILDDNVQKPSDTECDIPSSESFLVGLCCFQKCLENILPACELNICSFATFLYRIYNHTSSLMELGLLVNYVVMQYYLRKLFSIEWDEILSVHVYDEREKIKTGSNADVKVFFRIHLEWPKKTTKTFSQDNRWSGQYSNQVPPQMQVKQGTVLANQFVTSPHLFVCTPGPATYEYFIASQGRLSSRWCVSNPR